MQPLLAFLALSAAVGFWGHDSDTPIRRRVILIGCLVLVAALFGRRFL